jgi:hypothetical protein
MAVNELTGIDRDKDRFVVFLPGQENSTKTNEIWPRLDGGPVNGGFVNGEMYYKKVHIDPPPYDHRYSLVTTHGKVETEPTPPAGYPVGTWRPFYELELRPLETQLAHIDTEFQYELQRRYPQVADLSTYILAADIITKKQNGGVLTTEEQATLDAINVVGDGVRLMADRRAEMKAAATAGEDYDVTAWPS